MPRYALSAILLAAAVALPAAAAHAQTPATISATDGTLLASLPRLDAPRSSRACDWCNAGLCQWQYGGRTRTGVDGCTR